MVSDGALEKLRNYSYPGNIRELENMIMSAVSLADQEHVLTEKQVQIQEAYREVSADTDFDGEQESLDQYLGRIESAVIRTSLANCEGNISKAASSWE